MHKKVIFGAVTLNTVTASNTACFLPIKHTLSDIGAKCMASHSFSGHTCFLKLYRNNENLVVLAVKYNLAEDNCCSPVRLNFVNISICLSRVLVFTV